MITGSIWSEISRLRLIEFELDVGDLVLDVG